MQRAARAMRSARLLLNDDDVVGACNRAYYAMFEAAQASVLSAGNADPADIRTHSGLIRRFGIDVVQAGLIPRETGRLLAQAQQVRRMTDYNQAHLDGADAEQFIAKADKFVTAVEDRFFAGSRD